MIGNEASSSITIADESNMINNPIIDSPIDQPIDQRNTGKGNPNAILHSGRPLNNRQQKLLNMLAGYDSKTTVNKKDANMKDLSALTAATGDEFSMFTKCQEKLIIRGNSNSVNVNKKTAYQLNKQGYRWSGHTHPGYTDLCLWASDGDKLILKQFKQKMSAIYNSKGNHLLFNK